MKRVLKKLVFVEPKSTHLHVYSKVCIPRLGSGLLGTIMRAKGYDVRVYIEDIHDLDMAEVLSADLVALSAITSTAPHSYRLPSKVRGAAAREGSGATRSSAGSRSSRAPRAACTPVSRPTSSPRTRRAARSCGAA